MPPHASVARRPDMLTRTDAATYLGTSVKWLAAHLPHKGGPPILKVGRAVYYLRQDLDAWLLAQRIGPSSCPATTAQTVPLASESTVAPTAPSGGSTSASLTGGEPDRAREHEIAARLRQ